MILPIGHEESATRRHPFVVYGVALVCVLVALLVPVPEYSASDEEREMALEDAVLFWLESPYLELDPDLVEAAADQLPEYRSMLQRDRTGIYVPEDAELVAALQEELDGLSAWAMHRGVSHSAILTMTATWTWQSRTSPAMT